MREGGREGREGREGERERRDFSVVELLGISTE